MSRETLVNQISEREYDFIGHLKENRAPVMKKNKWGFVDEEKQLRVPLIYEKADEFIGGYAQVVKRDKSGTLKYTFVDLHGNELPDEEDSKYF